MRVIAQIGAISLACHVVRNVFKQIIGLPWHAIDASCVILSALMVANGHFLGSRSGTNKIGDFAIIGTLRYMFIFPLFDCFIIDRPYDIIIETLHKNDWTFAHCLHDSWGPWINAMRQELSLLVSICRYIISGQFPFLFRMPFRSWKGSVSPYLHLFLEMEKSKWTLPRHWSL